MMLGKHADGKPPDSKPGGSTKSGGGKHEKPSKGK